MTDEQKREAVHEMFQSKGWQVLKEVLEENKSVISDISRLHDAQQLHYAQGRLQTIQELLVLPDQIRQGIDDAL